MINKFIDWLNESEEKNYLDLLTARQIEWCNTHIIGEWYVNKEGEVYLKNETVKFKQKYSIFKL